MVAWSDFSVPAWSDFPVPTWAVVVCGVLFVYYKYAVWNFGTFKKLGIKGPRPYPVFGTLLPMMKLGIAQQDMLLRRDYGRVVGTYLGRRPLLMIFDTDVIKQIFVKDFANFTNRYSVPLEDYVLSQILTALKDEHWKHVRNHLTPTFSSGKLRKMNDKMLRCVETFRQNLEQKAESQEIFDFSLLCGAFTMDTIASTAFGLQIDSHNDPNNQFIKAAKYFFQFSFSSVKTLFFFFFPFLARPLSKMGLSMFPTDGVNFFVAVVNKAMDERREEDSDKVDFLQLMINAEVDDDELNSKIKDESKDSSEEKWSKSRGLSRREILAQSLIFFLAGYETVANTLSMFGYSLATNPDIQERLIEEIDEVMKDHTQLTYDVLKKMPYLDMCLSEVLRIYPAAARTDRIAKSDTVINGICIPKDMIVGIPIYGIHHDPEIWPDPEKFDPERFTTNAKESRDPFAYLPFGHGPRNCIGNRLALMEVKMAMAHILQKLKFVVCEETQIPLKLQKIRMQGENGIKIRMMKR